MANNSVNPDQYTRAVVRSPNLQRLADAWANVENSDEVTFYVMDEHDCRQRLTGLVKKLEHTPLLTLVELVDGSGETWEISIHKGGPDQHKGTAFNPMAMRMANLVSRRR